MERSATVANPSPDLQSTMTSVNSEDFHSNGFSESLIGIKPKQDFVTCEISDEDKFERSLECNKVPIKSESFSDLNDGLAVKDEKKTKELVIVKCQTSLREDAKEKKKDVKLKHNSFPSSSLRREEEDIDVSQGSSSTSDDALHFQKNGTAQNSTFIHSLFTEPVSVVKTPIDKIENLERVGYELHALNNAERKSNFKDNSCEGQTNDENLCQTYATMNEVLSAKSSHEMNGHEMDEQCIDEHALKIVIEDVMNLDDNIKDDVEDHSKFCHRSIETVPIVTNVPSMASGTNAGASAISLTRNVGANADCQSLSETSSVPDFKKRYDRRSITSISSDSKMEMNHEISPISPRFIVMSQSTEKITGRVNMRGQLQFFPGGCIVRSSKSQENYFDSSDLTCVDIDLDDNIASSVDALHYDTSSMASVDSIGGVPFDWPTDTFDTDLNLEDMDDRSSRGSGGECSSELVGSNSLLPLSTTDGVESRVMLETDDAGSKLVLETDGIGSKETGDVVSKVVQETGGVGCRVTLDVGGVGSKVKPVGVVLNQQKLKQQVEEQCHSMVTPGVALSINSQEANDIFSDSDIKQTRDVLFSSSEMKSETSFALTTVSLTTSHHAQQTELNSREINSLSSQTSIAAEILLDGVSRVDFGEKNDNLESLFLKDESFFRQPTTKDVDRPSAARLAKRLFYLHGFKKSDVSRHLSKKNSFSQLVGEEYLKYFDFTDESLISSLRRFIKHLTIFGETQERERLLAHFSYRYHQCNANILKSEDCCHTLACAMMLLNNDLHGQIGFNQNMSRKMTLIEFISNLSDMNEGEDFPKDLLKSLYLSIKNQPLEYESEECIEGGEGEMQSNPMNIQSMNSNQSCFTTYNPFFEVPDPNNAVEFKKGYVMRKCCIEPDGRKTPLGKRGWKMFYATLRDLVLHINIDEHGFKRNQQYTNTTNAIHIHHSLATKATDYKKKNHVFRLQTADTAQYLIQTSDSKECQEWIDAINFVAASYSAPALLPSTASQERFQKPLLPSSYTKLNLREQINHHERMIVEFEKELHEHRKNPPEKGAKTRLIQDYCKKENYLKFELKRYKTYCRLLQYKVSTFPELESSLTEMSIGEVDEPVLSSSPHPPQSSSVDFQMQPPNVLHEHEQSKSNS